MTSEQKANELAAAFVAAEEATEALSLKMKAFTKDAAGIGPITRDAFFYRARGIQGAIAQLHVDIKQFDPRPSPFDGGGK